MNYVSKIKKLYTDNYQRFLQQMYEIDPGIM